MTSPTLVAHRGWSSRYPENTLLALTAALGLGARWLEFDVQLTRDGRPYLFHDRELDRCAGRSGRFADLSAAEVAALDAGCASRFGERFAGTRVPALDEVVDLIARHPEAGHLVEIKSACLEHHSIDAVLEAILPQLEPLGTRALPISFAAELLAALPARGWRDFGWILRAVDASSLDAARALGATLLVADRKILPRRGPLPAGPWRWAVYAVNDPREAVDWAERGAVFVETDCFGELIADAALAGWFRS